jgi:hypothetical protein
MGQCTEVINAYFRLHLARIIWNTMQKGNFRKKFIFLLTRIRFQNRIKGNCKAINTLPIITLILIIILGILSHAGKRS